MYESAAWPQRIRTLIKALVLATAFGVGFVFVYYVTAPPKAPLQEVKLTIMAAPSGSSVKLNGKSMKNSTYNVAPGKYTLEVSKKGFASQTITKELVVDSAAFMGAALTPNSPSTANWYTKHAADQRLAEGVSGAEASAYSQNVTSQSPIVGRLPYSFITTNGNGFRIDIGATAKDKPSDLPQIYVTADTVGERSDAKQWLQSNGADLSTLYLSFINTSNPFLKAPELPREQRGE